MFLQLQVIFDIFNLHAGVVQRLVCDLAKVEMAVRFRSLAPFENNLRTYKVCKFLFYIKGYSSLSRKEDFFDVGI